MILVLAAGAMAPFGARTTATGTVALQPGLLSLIIFLWTPPHFRSLSLCYEDDYHRTGLPMLPVVKGADVTLNSVPFCCFSGSDG